MIDHYLPFFFSAVGVFNGIILWWYLLFSSSYNKLRDISILALLLMFLIRVGVSCIHFFDSELGWSYIQLGLSANFMIGPLAFVCCNTLIYQLSKPQINALKWHIIVNASLITVFGFLYTFEDHPYIWDHKIRYVTHTQLTFYLIYTGFLLIPSIKRLFKKQKQIAFNELKAIFIYTSTVLVCLGFVVSLYVNYIIGPVFASFLFYLTTIIILAGRKRIAHWMQLDKRYQNRSISVDDVKKLIQQLNFLMKEKKIFKTPNLKLSQLADALGISPSLLSQLLNEEIGKSFSLYINEYRVQEAKKLLQNKNNLTVEAIGYEVGFNSKSSFYAIFKKATGKTPASFQKNSNIII
ncbi:MAG: helix-turn-helix transcriptional regulator [Bacteroidota bacterium]